MSTTQTATGSILGTGLGRKGAEVRWWVMGRMAVAWLLTLPAAGIVGAACWVLANTISGLSGVLVVFGILIGAAAYIWARSRRNPVDTSNVNDDWDDGLIPASDKPALPSAPTEKSL